MMIRLGNRLQSMHNSTINRGVVGDSPGVGEMAARNWIVTRMIRLGNKVNLRSSRIQSGDYQGGLNNTVELLLLLESVGDDDATSPLLPKSVKDSNSSNIKSKQTNRGLSCIIKTQY